MPLIMPVKMRHKNKHLLPDVSLTHFYVNRNNNNQFNNNFSQSSPTVYSTAGNVCGNVIAGLARVTENSQRHVFGAVTVNQVQSRFASGSNSRILKGVK